MPHFKRLLTSFVLALAASFGLGGALSTPSFAISVYTFTFTDTNAQDNAGQVEVNLNGSFSIPVSDFGGNPILLPNSDVVALSFLGVSHATFYNTNPGSTSYTTADVYTPSGNSMYFTYVGGIPQVWFGTGDLAQTPDGQVLFVGSTFETSGFVGFSWQGSQSQSLVEVAGNWATTTSDLVATTPLPAALPLFASGVGLLGWGARRRQRKQHAAA